MTGEFTKQGLYSAEEVLEAEFLAGRKALLYANTLTDIQLAEFFRKRVDQFAERFHRASVIPFESLSRKIRRSLCMTVCYFCLMAARYSRTARLCSARVREKVCPLSRPVATK